MKRRKYAMPQSHSDRMIDIMNAEKDRSVEQRAQELVGADWFNLDEKTRHGVIGELITSGALEVSNDEIFAAGGAVGTKGFMVTYTLSNGKKIDMKYGSEDEMNEAIGNYFAENDVEDVKIEEIKEEVKKKSLFDLAKTDVKKTSTKSKNPDVRVEGIESEISQYDEIVKKIKNLEAEKEIIGGRLKQIGRDKFLELYENDGRNPNNFNLADGDESILYMTYDKYLKVEPEKEAILSQYEGLLGIDITYKLDNEILEKKTPSGETNGEILNDLILNSTLISDSDKEKLLKVSRTVAIKKGTIDRLMDYDNPEEIYTLIEPITVLK